ncbi:putative HR-like lesion-inducer [Arabidopsis thaliana]|jgi:hypothetical protein|uniref:At3g23190 n=4 Tax=Arabidopsis TaxID=3701 RepID=Q9LTC9_ARATH|nr:HR-like lesion-inducing protein-like protein [Arabidopsis thaliana]KAG7626290.1 HR-like lesion-inducer [Arabidopsis thaliana x Arabidopsis arenosa]KAG7632275.1 HR-like lesion-inducer [Arabidopsis suecica]AAS76276.1 At3g23190 [Arabidopsis thaliana]AEE76733.1 HR-like lesion-inducing protein-like protein [Arabidopsis thaliana]OAP06105.1 hypothetical protein AXX17_AT3G25030 [Arabidopsis thaliana]|eukprot:NP_188960.1 HR-like lesion-inducing protein-like protein [Arabidopsis thaliana]
MEKTQESVVRYGKKIEKMPYLMPAGRVVFASAFLVSAWREYYGFGLAADELRPKLGFFENQAKAIVALGILMKFVGGILFIFNTYVGAALLLVYQAILSPILYDFYNRDYDRDHFTVFYTKFKEFVEETTSADGGVAMSLYTSVVNEESRQKFIDQLNEIARIAISNPLFTPSDFNTLFIRFIKGVGIAAALACFIAMKHRHAVLIEKTSKKQKTN